jgi:four helix bundle protein
MKDFRKYKVWTCSHQLTLLIYKKTHSFPRSEIYGLVSQIRGSAASIGSNIAEGCGRDSDAEFMRFLRIASGSASETENHVILAADLGYINKEDTEELLFQVQRVKRMLTGLIQKIRASKRKGGV